jgi:hypothetical protein
MQNMKNWIARVADEAMGEGLRADGSMIRHRADGAPGIVATCPNHPNMKTSWRGPMPTKGDAPMIIDSKGYECIVQPNPSAERAHEAARLWRIADKYHDSPGPFGDHHLIWQMGLCGSCLLAQQEEWLNEVWPPPPEKRMRGAMPEEGDGDWDL